MLIYYDGKGGPQKGTFPVAKETQVMPSNVAPKKDDANKAFLVRTDKKIMYLVADTPQLRDIKMKELSTLLLSESTQVLDRCARFVLTTPAQASR